MDEDGLRNDRAGARVWSRRSVVRAAALAAAAGFAVTASPAALARSLDSDPPDDISGAGDSYEGSGDSYGGDTYGDSYETVPDCGDAGDSGEAGEGGSSEPGEPGDPVEPEPAPGDQASRFTDSGEPELDGDGDEEGEDGGEPPTSCEPVMNNIPDNARGNTMEKGGTGRGKRRKHRKRDRNRGPRRVRRRNPILDR